MSASSEPPMLCRLSAPSILLQFQRPVQQRTSCLKLQLSIRNKGDEDVVDAFVDPAALCLKYVLLMGQRIAVW